MTHTYPTLPVAPVLWAAVGDRQGPTADRLVARLAPLLDAVAHACLVQHEIDGELPAFDVVEFRMQVPDPQAFLRHPPSQVAGAWHVLVETTHMGKGAMTRLVSWTRAVDNQDGVPLFWRHPLFHAITATVGTVLADLLADPIKASLAGTTLVVRLDSAHLTAHQRLAMAKAHTLLETADCA